MHLHLIAERPSHDDRHVDPVNPRLLSEHDTRSQALDAGRLYLWEHPESWLHDDGQEQLSGGRDVDIAPARAGVSQPARRNEMQSDGVMIVIALAPPILLLCGMLTACQKTDPRRRAQHGGERVQEIAAGSPLRVRSGA
jgi:hypothetical protein